MIKIEIPRTERFYRDQADLLLAKGGVYFFHNNDFNELLYIGKTCNVKQRVKIHLTDTRFFVNQRGEKHGSTSDIQHNFKWIEVFYVDCPVERDIYETYLINTLRPSLNVNKVYLYKSSRQMDRYKTEKQILYEKLKQEKFEKAMESIELNI